jgi:hypothetical protein
MTSKIKVNNIEDTSGNALVTKCGSTLTIGKSGDTISLASGASQTGFGRSGSVDWQTTPKTSTFTAASGEGYFINSSSAITANLPAGSAGAIVAFSDYARNFTTYNLRISPNGSEKIGGVASDAFLSVDGQSATFVYVDSTKGWLNVQNAEDTEKGNEFIVATGGTITTCGNDKIHTFTSPGTFTVSQVHPCAANNLVSYVVVGGGGAGGTDYSATSGGGGGAGGFRETKSPATPYTASPLDGYSTPGNRITVTATGFPITVGAGATANPSGPGPESFSNGSNSIFSSITSAGGGGGASNRQSSPSPSRIAGSGGSGGGASFYRPSCNGSGNTPPVTPAQGSNGGTAGTPPAYSSGGGGGAGAVGGNGSSSKGGDGGAGVSSEITGSSVTRSGGGGGAAWEDGPASSHGAGGSGGGGAGGPDGGNAGVAGTTNTGGGGGGASGASSEGNLGGNGGSGIVIIRYKYQ